MFSNEHQIQEILNNDQTELEITQNEISFKENLSQKDNTDQKSVVERLDFEDVSITKRPTNDFTANRFRRLKNKIQNLYEIIKELKNRVVSKVYFMLVVIILAAFLGVGLGFGLRPTNLSPQAKIYCKFPGELFLRVLQFVALPLYFFKLICGVIDLKRVSSNRKIIVYQTLLFFILSLTLSFFVGLFFVLIIKPGLKAKNFNFTMESYTSGDQISTSDTILDMLR